VKRIRKRLYAVFMIIALLLMQFSNIPVQKVSAAGGFVIRSGTMPVDSSGIYASQTKNATIPATEVTKATVTTNNGTATLTRNNNQVTVNMTGGNPTSFTNGSTTLTDNGNTTNSGSASTVIPGLYDVVSKTTTNGTVTTATIGDTLTATWSGGNKYQVRVPPYTQTTTTTTYENYSHHATTSWISCSGSGPYSCTGYTTNYYYDSNCNLGSSTRTGNTVTTNVTPNTSPSNSGTISCSKPITKTTTTDAYNYEDRWDYSGTFNYRTATYTYNTIVSYDYKDYAPTTPTLTAPQDLSDGGTITFSKPTDDYTAVNDLNVSLEWQQEGASDWNSIFTDKKITDSVFKVSGSNVSYNWNSSSVDGMIKLRLVTKDGFNNPVYSYVHGDPDYLFRLSHKPVINAVSPIGGSQANTVTPTYKWIYNQDEGEAQKGFYLQVRKVGASSLTLDTGLVTSSLAEYVQPSNKPLEWGSPHEWRMQPLSVTGVLGEWSTWHAFGANSIPEIESVSTVSTDTLHVKTKPTPDTTGYKYYRGIDEIHDGPQLEIDDNNLPSNTEQYYNVRAYNAVAESPLSSTKSAFTFAKTPEIEGIETTPTSLIIKLKGVNPQYTYHEIEFRKKGESSWLPFATGTGNLFVSNGVSKDTTYEVRVRDFNGMTNPLGIPTDYAQMEATTKVDVPTNANFTDVTADSFKVTIDPNGNAATTKYRFWIEGVTDKTEYSSELSHIFSGLPEGNRTYTVVGQAMGINSESNPIQLGTVTTKAHPVNAEDITLTAEAGKIKGSFATGKNSADTKYEISDGATGQVLGFSDSNTTFELIAPNPNELHTVTIRAQDKLLNVTDPVSKDIYSLSLPVITPELTVVSANEVSLTFDLNGNPAETEVKVRSVKGDSYDSGWVAGTSSIQILNRTSNTQQQYEIITRNKDGVESTAVISPARFTLANPVITAVFDAGYENIKISLTANNPAHTEYKLVNTTTGDVRDWATETSWDNNPLVNESENFYEVLVRNGDGIELPVAEIGSMKTRKAIGEFIETPREAVPTDVFDPATRDGKTIEYNGEETIIVRGPDLPLDLTNTVNITDWRFNINDGAWSEWFPVSDNKIEKKFTVSEPGLYKVTINFKNQYGNDAGTVIRWYLADWIAPNFSFTTDKITKASEAKLALTYSDNLITNLWYQINSDTWRILDKDELVKTLNQDNKFDSGTIRVSDVVGNVRELPYDILSLNDDFVTFDERIDGYKVNFNIDQKIGQRHQVRTTNLLVDENRTIDLTTKTIDVAGLLDNTTYETRVGIQLPGDPLWLDPKIYQITTKDNTAQKQADVDLYLSKILARLASGERDYWIELVPPEDTIGVTAVAKIAETKDSVAISGVTKIPAREGDTYTVTIEASKGTVKSTKEYQFTVPSVTKEQLNGFLDSTVVKHGTDGTNHWIEVLTTNDETITTQATVVETSESKPVVTRETFAAQEASTYHVKVEASKNGFTVSKDFTVTIPNVTEQQVDNYLKSAMVRGKNDTIKYWIEVVPPLESNGVVSTANVVELAETKNVESDIVTFDGAADKTYTVKLSASKGNVTLEKVVVITLSKYVPPAGGGGTLPPTETEPPQSEEEKFKEEAGSYLSSIKLEADGELNSGSAWIDVTAQASSYQVTATIEGQSKSLGAQTVRFDGLDDNKEYSVVVVVSNGKFTHSQTFTITTPNRTPPVVNNAYMKGNSIILEVTSVKGIQK